MKKIVLTIMVLINILNASFLDAIKNSMVIKDNTTGKEYDYYGNEIKYSNNKKSNSNVIVNLSNKSTMFYDSKTNKYIVNNKAGIIETYQILRVYKEVNLLDNTLNIIINYLTNKIKDQEFYYNLQKLNRLLIGQKPGMDTSVDNFSEKAGIIDILNDSISYINTNSSIPINKIQVDISNYKKQLNQLKQNLSKLTNENSDESQNLKILIKNTLYDVLDTLSYISFNVNIYSQYRVINEFNHLDINNKNELKNYIYEFINKLNN